MHLRPPTRALFAAGLVAMAAMSAMAACSLAISTSGLAGGPLDAAQESPPDSFVAVGDAGDAEPSKVDANADARTLPDGGVTWSGNGHAYAIRIVPGGVSWEQARLLATAEGGHLATLGSVEENNFVLSLAEDHLGEAFNGGNVGPYLGGYQPNPVDGAAPDAGWAWIDGTPWGFTYWAVNQPDNTGGAENYLDLYRPGGVIGWNDDAVTGTVAPVLSYVLEID